MDIVRVTFFFHSEKSRDFISVSKNKFCSDFSSAQTTSNSFWSSYKIKHN